MHLLWYRFKRDNIEIPFPVQTVHLKEVTPETQRTAHEQEAAGLLVLMEKVDIFKPSPATSASGSSRRRG